MAGQQARVTPINDGQAATSPVICAAWAGRNRRFYIWRTEASPTWANWTSAY
ncbi:hypothetical protein [Paenibacillus pabuli]|uniref:hypothetical protein n=1 Tax=Paenibacillus pabuli TaxID=1472 RepID=UPI003CE758D7